MKPYRDMTVLNQQATIHKPSNREINSISSKQKLLAELSNDELTFDKIQGSFDNPLNQLSTQMDSVMKSNITRSPINVKNSNSRLRNRKTGAESKQLPT